MDGVIPAALRASLALLGAATVVAGCGDGPPDAVVDTDGTLRLRLDEYRISPVAIEVPDGRVEIAARNVGVLTHNVKVEEVVDEEGVTPELFGGTETMQPGESAPAVALRLVPGRYRLVCSIGNHENLGQYAELEVTQGS